MYTSFLSKLARLNSTPRCLNLKFLNENPSRSQSVGQPVKSLLIEKPGSNNDDIKKFPQGKPNFYSYTPFLQRHFSSSAPSSSGSSDGGEKGESPKGKPIPTILIDQESLQESSSKGLPSPACASLPQDFMTTPLEEHEVGLGLSRRGRSKPPLNDGTTGQQSPSKKKDQKPRKSKKTDPSAPSPPTTANKTSSKQRAKDRLEALTRLDTDRRMVFAYKLLLVIEDEPDILDHILWTDECNFNLPKLASLIKKPPIAESELLPQIAWCGMSTKGPVGPYFFNSHVTDKSYIRMLENYVLPELELKGYNLKELYFQQDGAPWHRSQLVLDFLASVFDDRLISLGTKFIWPPRSQDLTPMDYFFWDYMKVKLDFKHSKYDLCFQKSFREILTREVNTASLTALQGAIYQLPERLEMCLSENGGRFVHLLYPDRYEKDGTRKPRKQGNELFKTKVSKDAANNAQSCTITSSMLDKVEDNESIGPPLPVNNNANNSK